MSPIAGRSDNDTVTVNEIVRQAYNLQESNKSDDVKASNEMKTDPNTRLPMATQTQMPSSYLREKIPPTIQFGARGNTSANGGHLNSQVLLSHFGNTMPTKSFSPQFQTVSATNSLTFDPNLWLQATTGQILHTMPNSLHPPSVTPPPPVVVPQQVVSLCNYASIFPPNSIPTALPNYVQAVGGNMQVNANSAIPTGQTSTTVQSQVQSRLQIPQRPILTVQDHPLINPVYNGVNPAYPGLRVLNQYPPVFAVDSFLTQSECNFLICVAQDSFSPAPVVGKGAGEVSPSRTSTTCYLAREDLPMYMEKICALTGKPVDHCELPQVGRYFPSQQYLQHFDAFDLSDEDGRRFMSNGGQRTVTVLVYLNDVEKGGGTSFPALNLEVKPKKGMAIVFFPATVDGLLDKMTLHAAKPAVDTKYVSQVWVRQAQYNGLPSKRMFSSIEQARVVQKSLQLAAANNGVTNVPEVASIHDVFGSSPNGISGQLRQS